MPSTPVPEPKSNVGDLFTRQLTGLADYARDQAAAETGTGQAGWYRPYGFQHNLDELKGLDEAFSRNQHVDEFIKAVSDAKSPGTVTDVHLSQLQGDILAGMERAYRARHLTTCRARAHAFGRLQGHGHQFGVIRQGMLGHVVDIDRMNKGDSA